MSVCAALTLNEPQSTRLNIKTVIAIIDILFFIFQLPPYRLVINCYHILPFFITSVNKRQMFFWEMTENLFDKNEKNDAKNNFASFKG